MIYIERWKECLEKFIELTPDEKARMLDAMETMLATYAILKQTEEMKAMGIWHEDEEPEDGKGESDAEMFRRLG